MRYIFLFLATITLGYASPKIPTATGYVTDLTGSLSATSKASLDQTLQTFDMNKQIQIGILVVPTLENESLEEYANTVFRSWGIGAKKTNKGLLILIAKKEGRSRIEVGYGLEGDLPDGKVGALMDKYLVTPVKAGNVEAGLNALVPAIISSLDGTAPIEAPPVPDYTWILYIAGAYVGVVLLFGFGSMIGIPGSHGIFIFLIEITLNIIPLLLSGGKSGGFGGGSSGGGGSSR